MIDLQNSIEQVIVTKSLARVKIYHQIMKFTMKKSFDLTGIRTRISQLPVKGVSQLHYPAILTHLTGN
jgi:hypothetical protein